MTVKVGRKWVYLDVEETEKLRNMGCVFDVLTKDPKRGTEKGYICFRHLRVPYYRDRKGMARLRKEDYDRLFTLMHGVEI